MIQVGKPVSTSEKLGTGINATVRRIALEYSDRGQLSKVTSHNNATVGSCSIVNQVTLSYNAFNELTQDAQSHSGAVTVSTPKVGYSYANGSGVIQERYRCSVFGIASFLPPGFTARAATTFAWNFLSHGQFRDVETGWDNYGFRYYLPWLGRSTSGDPFGSGRATGKDLTAGEANARKACSKQ